MRRLQKIFIYTILILLASSILIPTLWVLLASVKDDSEFYSHPWSLPNRIDFENFISAWEEANMGEYFLNSAVVTVLALFILLISAVPAAYALSHFSFSTRPFFRSYFMAGLFVNASYIVVPIFLLLLEIDGLFGYSLMLNNRFILALVYASTALPFTVYLLSGFFASLPREYEEASYIDGASRLSTLIFIMAPMARPAIVTALLFNFLAFWNEYIIALTLMTEERAKTLPVGLMNLMKAQNASAQYGRMYAGLVIVMLPTLILYMILQKKITEGLSSGGIKG